MASDLDLGLLGNIIAQILSGQSMPAHGGNTPNLQATYKHYARTWPGNVMAETPSTTPIGPGQRTVYGAPPTTSDTDLNSVQGYSFQPGSDGSTPMSPYRLPLEQLLRGSR